MSEMGRGAGDLMTEAATGAMDTGAGGLSAVTEPALDPASLKFELFPVQTGVSRKSGTGSPRPQSPSAAGCLRSLRTNVSNRNAGTPPSASCRSRVTRSNTASGPSTRRS
jgi:hypothetical protein